MGGSREEVGRVCEVIGGLSRAIAARTTCVVYVSMSIIAGVWCASGAGCAGAGRAEGLLDPPGAPTGPTGTVRQVVADWDDVEAAVDIAVSRAQCGYLEWHSDRKWGGSGGPVERGPDRRRWYTLLTIRGAEVMLEITRDAEGGAVPLIGSPEAMTIRCRVGPEGDANYEALLVGYLAERLEELKGNKAVPIVDPWGINLK